ncbi:oxidoreductase with NAD+ or NADP+ as acceptor [Saitozyma sp. JCM 24511]|nr:oxidoreductase with NAD+ or NADP+ as acceptor [Saitozyma sp. JCM 24511]
MGFAELLAPVPEPVTPLGRLRILSPTCGLRVNAFAFGGMSLGEAWADILPPLDQEKSFALLDAWYQAGGVHIDTSNHYQNEESETIIGEWLAARGIRDHLVIGTKFTSTFRGWKHGKNEAANLSGNHRKSIHVSLRESLKKLQTDYVDILYVHFWDYTTSIPELMDTLDSLIKQGKVLHLGASNLPAWVVAGCNAYATTANKTPFVVYQGKWNVLDRAIEQDIIPMARHYNMAIQPWAALAQGRLQTRAQREKLEASGTFRKGPKGELTELELEMSNILEEVAEKHQVSSLAPILLAWLYAKYTYCFPVIGLHDTEASQLGQNIAGIGIHLDEEDVAKIDAVNPTNFGYPNNFNGEDPHETGRSTAVPSGQLGTIDWVVDRQVYSSHMR